MATLEAGKEVTGGMIKAPAEDKSYTITNKNIIYMNALYPLNMHFLWTLPYKFVLKKDGTFEIYGLLGKKPLTPPAKCAVAFEKLWIEKGSRAACMCMHSTVLQYEFTAEYKKTCSMFVPKKGTLSFPGGDSQYELLAGDLGLK